MATNYKVRLVSVLNNIAQSTGSFTGQEVVFDNTPSFSESGGVRYNPVQPIHMPGAVQVYQNTEPRNFSIGAHFVSRTRGEATTNAFYLQLLRSWRYPFFGQGSSTREITRLSSDDKQRLEQEQTDTQRRLNQIANQQARGLTAQEQEQINIARARASQDANGFDLLGAPPEVLYLYAYSSPETNREATPFVNINRIPVVLTGLDIVWPEDVDYLPTYYDQPFPVKMEVSISLAETHSPKEFEQFSLIKYKTGQLDFF